jgi:hypothetical protein
LHVHGVPGRGLRHKISSWPALQVDTYSTESSPIYPAEVPMMRRLFFVLALVGLAAGCQSSIAGPDLAASGDEARAVGGPGNGSVRGNDGLTTAGGLSLPGSFRDSCEWRCW